jgi:hypothetical protein
MKKRIIALVLTLVCAFSLVAQASAASEPASGPDVRVNGYIVKFTDAEPFINSDSRTMIPLRAVTEAMGARVDWDQKNQSAIIEKNGIQITIPIGSQTFTVKENGQTRTVEMDTKAIIKGDRTYVPIRYVAEALGAYVDYSSTHRTVGIWDDVLTAEQIATLRAYPYSTSDHAISYETAKARKNVDQLAYFYGTDRDQFTGDSGYANSREHLYACLDRQSRYPFEAIDKVLTNASNDEFFATVVKEAIAEIAYFSDNISFEFIADTSCLYQEDNADNLTVSVRGIMVMKCNVKPTTLTGDEMAMVTRNGFYQIDQGVTTYLPVDIHMNSQANYCVNVNTIVALGEQYN